MLRRCWPAFEPHTARAAQGEHTSHHAVNRPHPQRSVGPLGRDHPPAIAGLEAEPGHDRRVPGGLQESRRRERGHCAFPHPKHATATPGPAEPAPSATCIPCRSRSRSPMGIWTLRPSCPPGARTGVTTRCRVPRSIAGLPPRAPSRRPTAAPTGHARAWQRRPRSARQHSTRQTRADAEGDTRVEA